MGNDAERLAGESQRNDSDAVKQLIELSCPSARKKSRTPEQQHRLPSTIKSPGMRAYSY
jgi:hypothetical protein